MFVFVVFFFILISRGNETYGHIIYSYICYFLAVFTILTVLPSVQIKKERLRDFNPINPIN